jgi:hypothetical protein
MRYYEYGKKQIPASPLTPPHMFDPARLSLAIQIPALVR